MKVIMHMKRRYGFACELLGLHLIYFLLLLWVYKAYIVVIHGYAGFVDALNINKAIFAPFMISAAFVLLRNNGLPSYFFLNLIIALTVTPSLVLFCGSDLPFSFIIVTWMAFAILCIVKRLIRLRRIRVRHINTIVLLRLLAAASLLVIASAFAFGGGKIINLDLSLVYEFRREAAANLPPVFGYLMPNFAKVVVPVGIVLSLLYKRWKFLVLFILCSIMIFALTSHKGPLFVPIIIILVYWFSWYSKALKYTMLALITLVLIGALDFYLRTLGMGGIIGWIGSLGVRRSLLVPSLMNWAYYDFFAANPYNYWAQSKFTFGLVSSSYHLSIPELVGMEMFGLEMHANTGWIGSGMANAGYFGVTLYSVLIGLLLSLCDAYAKKLGYSFVLAVFMIPVLNAARSVDLAAMLLTHGLFLLLLIVILMKPSFENSAQQLSDRS